MEAFGLAAGVLQVAGFGAEVGSTLWRCAKKLQNASKELESIAGQVETTALSLKRVDELLKDPATKALHTPKLYEDTNIVSQGCHDVFRELDTSVKAYEAKSTKGKMRILSRTKWLFDSGRLTELGQVLRRYNDVLHLMVSVMTIVEGRRAATKDELQALEVNLQVLALSNKDLSNTNKTLTETIAAISRAPKSPFLPPGTISTRSTSNFGAQATQGSMTTNTLALVPPSNISAQVVPSDPTSEHLQRCMDSVQELAKTIACAMDKWHGRGLLGCSDIQESYAKVSANIKQLPADGQATRDRQQSVMPPMNISHPQTQPQRSDTRAEAAKSPTLPFFNFPGIPSLTTASAPSLGLEIPDGERNPGTLISSDTNSVQSRSHTLRTSHDICWSRHQIQSWLVVNEFSDAWKAAFDHLDVRGSQFLDLGRSHVQRSIGFMAYKLLPQVTREYEGAEPVTRPTPASVRDEARRLRKLVRELVAFENDFGAGDHASIDAGAPSHGQIGRTPDAVESLHASIPDPSPPDALASDFGGGSLTPLPAIYVHRHKIQDRGSRIPPPPRPPPPQAQDGRMEAKDDVQCGFAGSDPNKRRGRAAPSRRCYSCNCAETAEWRRGPDGAHTLCNACGLHYAKMTRGEKIEQPAQSGSQQPIYSPQAYDPMAFSKDISAVPLEDNQPLTSATYIPGGEPFGPGVGIPPLFRGNRESQSPSSCMPALPRAKRRRATSRQAVDQADADDQQCKQKRPRIETGTSVVSNLSSEDPRLDQSQRSGDVYRDSVTSNMEGDNDDSLTGDASAVQALLSRWLNSSASALLLKNDETVR